MNAKILNHILVVIALLLIGIAGQYLYATFDLTEEKRFTLTQPTVEELESINSPVNIKILLDGEFPAGFKRLQLAVMDMVRKFQNHCPYIESDLEDPNEGSIERINLYRQELAKDGIVPVNLRIKGGAERKEKLIYPYAIIYHGGKSIPVNFLVNNIGAGQEENLNNSISLLEYSFINAIRKLRSQERPEILFTSGHGELNKYQTARLETILRQSYITDRVPLDSTISISQEVDLVIVAKPKEPFSDRDKFILDQYIMNGGKVLWLIDRMNVSLDSMSGRNEYVPSDYDLNLDDLFFKYGFRIKRDLVLDLECTRIPQVIGSQGGKPQVELFPWFYHPLVNPSQTHPIGKNVDRVNLFFPSSIDTVKTKYPVSKTTLLASSKYSRFQLSPLRLNFEILRYEPDPSKFNRPEQVLGLYLEGEFSSLFENNVSSEMASTLNQIGIEFRAKSEQTRMIVVSDGDLAKNLVNTSNGKPEELGYNKWEKFVFPGNKDFIINAIEYLLDDRGLLEARSREVKLRLLDKVRSEEERLKWQMINVGLPLIMLLIFGVVYNYRRNKKYAHV